MDYGPPPYTSHAVDGCDARDSIMVEEERAKYLTMVPYLCSCHWVALSQESDAVRLYEHRRPDSAPSGEQRVVVGHYAGRPPPPPPPPV